MRKTSAGLLSLALTAGLGSTLGAPAVSAATTPEVAPSAAPSAVGGSHAAGRDELPNPLEEKRRELRREALTMLLDGKGTVQRRGPSTVMKVGAARTAKSVDARGRVSARASREAQYVELSREKTDRIFVVLAEFGNQRDRRFPDKDLEPSIEAPKTFKGPRNNEIPAPDRTVDNSTVWQPDYDRAHLQELYFGKGSRPGSGGETESVRQYYERQSSGRYSISGTVTDWVKVKYNEARYGRSSDFNDVAPNVCADIVCDTSEDLVRDGVNQWYSDQIAAGRSKAAV